MRALITVVLILMAVAMMGMGLTAEDKIPIPHKTYTATAEDEAGVKTTGEKVSVEGNTYIKSKHGKGYIFIDFAEIARVEFGKSDQRDLPITVFLLNGEKINGSVRANDYFYGFASFGKFKVKLKELKYIEFSHGE